MVHRILTWCDGYVRVRLPGQEAERFLNICKNHGIYWWDISWNKDRGELSGFLKRRDYYKIRPIVQKTGTFPAVSGRFGGYFWLKRAGERISFWVGILCFFLLLVLLSGRIWGIEIEGESYHTKESILRYLDSLNVYGGMAGGGIVCQELETKLRKQYEDVGWVSVEKSGSKLYVRIDEVVLTKKQEETSGSLVAEEKGEVLSIVTRTGTARVRAGDKVKKGKVLISGKVKVIGDNDELVEKKQVRAQGTVVLRCTKHYENSLKKEYLQRKYSGRERTIYKWSIGEKNLFLYNPLKNLETYEKYDIIGESGCVCPFLSLRFPVFCQKKTFREVTEQKNTYSAQQAQKILSAQYQYYLSRMEDEGCYDLAGELRLQEDEGTFTGVADITYSKEQNSYR